MGVLRRAKNGDAHSRIRRALLAVQDGELSAATRELAEVVRNDSDDFDAYLALAHLYREQGEVGRALRLHQNLLLRGDLPPRLRPRAQLGLAEDLRSGGYRERAIAAFEELLAHDPKNERASQALCELFIESQKYDRALELVSGRGLLRRGGDAAREATILVQLGRAERDQGRNELARKHLRRAMKRDPSNAEAHIALGEVEAERGKDKAALAAWRGAVGLEQCDPDLLWERIASACAALGKAAELEKIARERCGAEPSDGAACRALARLLVSRAEIDAAVSELRRGLDAAPTDLATREQLGRLLLSEGRETDAAKELGELLEVLQAKQAERRGSSG